MHVTYAIHLVADTRLESSTKLEFKQRLSIAVGAAKGRSKRNLTTSEKLRIILKIKFVSLTLQGCATCMA